MKSSSVVLCRLILLCIVVTAQLRAAPPHDETELSRAYKLKPSGEINLVDNTMIRETLLPRGKYLVQHRLDGDTHSAVFTPIPDRKSTPRPAVVVLATLVPAKTAFSQSIVLALPPRDDRPTDKYYRIMKIDFAGESVEHLF